MNVLRQTTTWALLAGLIAAFGPMARADEAKLPPLKPLEVFNVARQFVRMCFPVPREKPKVAEHPSWSVTVTEYD